MAVVMLSVCYWDFGVLARSLFLGCGKQRVCHSRYYLSTASDAAQESCVFMQVHYCFASIVL